MSHASRRRFRGRRALPTFSRAIRMSPRASPPCDSSREQGRALADLGVNLNFAPVVDVDRGLVNPADRFTRIHQRAISNDPTIVTAAAAAYCDGLHEAGVRCTLKHFPGLRRVFADTHLGGANLDAAPSELAQSDWMPFRALMGRADAVTMLGHVTLTALDPSRPVSNGTTGVL
jgi:beta-N-acetylhexosaminidase